jgi:hypothetical protein
MFVNIVFLYSMEISALVILLFTEMGVTYGDYGVPGGTFGTPSSPYADLWCN